MKTVICLLALLCPILSSCQRLTITGQVHNTQRQPISQATVTLLRTGQHQYTTPNGRFSFTNTYATDSLRISAPGFITTTISNNTRGRLTIQLLPQPAGQQVTPAITNTPPIHPLAIGDTLPPITLTGVLNYPDSVIHLQDLKGKLVILDFWNSWCGACIASFPAMQQLQKQFGNDLQIILVNTHEADTPGRIRSFLDRRQKITGEKLSLPYALEQTKLLDYFPHTFIPHYVWINALGKVVAVTAGTEVNAATIQQAINGPIALREKKDIPDFDYSRPLFVKGNGGTGDNFIARSILTTYQEGIGNRMGLRRNDKGLVTGLYVYNSQLNTLLRLAYQELSTLAVNRFQFNPVLPAHYRSLPVNSYQDAAFCYELTIPPSGTAEAFAYLRQDIRRYLQIDVCLEERMVPCLVIEPISNVQPYMSLMANPVFAFDSSYEKPYLRQQTASAIAAYLEDKINLPVIDESGITDKLDIGFTAHFDYQSPAAWISAFGQAGITISIQDRPVQLALIEPVSPLKH